MTARRRLLFDRPPAAAPQNAPVIVRTIPAAPRLTSPDSWMRVPQLPHPSLLHKTFERSPLQRGASAAAARQQKRVAARRSTEMASTPPTMSRQQRQTCPTGWRLATENDPLRQATTQEFIAAGASSIQIAGAGARITARSGAAVDEQRPRDNYAGVPEHLWPAFSRPAAGMATLEPVYERPMRRQEHRPGSALCSLLLPQGELHVWDSSRGGETGRRARGAKPPPRPPTRPHSSAGSERPRIRTRSGLLQRRQMERMTVGERALNERCRASEVVYGSTGRQQRSAVQQRPLSRERSRRRRPPT